MEFLNRYLNAAFNIIRCAALKTRTEELTRANFVGKPLRLEACKENLKQTAVGKSKVAWSVSLRPYIYIYIRRYPPW